MKTTHALLQRGFTLIELMIVVAIVGLLSTMALPSFQDRVIRTQVGEGLAVAEIARQQVAAYYARNHRMPADNAAAGLPPADYIVGTHVTSVSVAEGAIDITFGNRANKFIAGKKVTLRPAVVEKYAAVPISWVCGNAPAAERMKAMGSNRTDLPNWQMPIDCRP